MPELTEDSMPSPTKHELSPRRSGRGYDKGLGVLLLSAVMMMLSACGSSSSGGSQQSATLSGNWQFTMATQTDGVQGDPTFSGGLLGGFFLQSNGSITGQTVYSVTSSTATNGPCNGGTAPLTITTSGQNVTITEVAGTQTFTLTGTLSSDGSSMSGNLHLNCGDGGRRFRLRIRRFGPLIHMECDIRAATYWIDHRELSQRRRNPEQFGHGQPGFSGDGYPYPRREYWSQQCDRHRGFEFYRSRPQAQATTRVSRVDPFR